MCWSKYASILLALVAFSLAAACGAASSPSPEVFFPQLRPNVSGGPDAATGGKLALGEEGCLRVKSSADDSSGWVPIWPASYELVTRGEEIRILDGKGRVVAQVGKEVSIGGGEAGLQKDFVKASMARELRERCPGTYWVVQEGTVHIPKRG